MFSRHFFASAIVLILAASLALALATAQDAGPDARAPNGKRLFGTAAALRVARVTAPQLSPDGQRVAYLVATTEETKDAPWKSVTQMWVVPAAGPASAARQYTRGEPSVANARWSPDGRLLAFLRAAGTGADAKRQVWFMYADGGEPWQVTQHKAGVSSFEFSPDGKTLLLVATPDSTAAAEARAKEHDDARVVDHHYEMAQLWSWDIASGAEKPLTHGDFTASDPHWSPDGSHVVFTTNPTPRLDDGSLQTVRVLDLATGEVRQLVAGPDPTHSPHWSPDGRQIAYLSAKEGLGLAQTDLYVVDAAGGAPRRLGTAFALDAGAPVWAPDGRTIYFSSDAREAEAVFAADVASGAIRRVSTQAAVIQIAAVSKDGQTAIGTWTDPTHPSEVFRSNLDFTALQSITNQNPWLADYALGATIVAQWKSAKDGLEIDGIVTEPVDFDPAHRYPFLLNPHGGPTGASLLSFNPTEQIMAANGYLVLEPNFRGSTGRGEKFARANQNDWGGGDYQDDMSGVDAMVAKGWADPNRMGAFGWSYGGFMTYWIDTQTPRFKAISPGAGLPDLYSMYSETDIHRYLRLFFDEKSPWDNFDEYWAHSPMKYVENVTTPTMILQGIADTRVPIPQAEEFYRALYERHVPVEFVEYPRENHGFVEPRHIQDRWRRYLVFFGQYLDNPPVTEPEAVLALMRQDLPVNARVDVASRH